MQLSLRCGFLFLLVVQCILPRLYFASVITLEDDGYKGIVVAIHKDVKEDLEILENIKVSEIHGN